MDAAELENRFTHHAPHGNQAERYTEIRYRAKQFAEVVLDLTPECREQALAMTNLEQTVFWANAAIARREERPLMVETNG